MSGCKPFLGSPSDADAEYVRDDARDTPAVLARLVENIGGDLLDLVRCVTHRERATCDREHGHVVEPITHADALLEVQSVVFRDPLQCRTLGSTRCAGDQAPQTRDAPDREFYHL